tara:strand:- start:393 stop:677 length:285 start_codon:yes stop_codon:yes gene_type:complete
MQSSKDNLVNKDTQTQKAVAWLQQVFILAVTVALAQQWGNTALRTVTLGLQQVQMPPPQNSVLSLALVTALAFQTAHVMQFDIANVSGGTIFRF